MSGFAISSTKRAAALAVGAGALIGWWSYARLTAYPAMRALDFTYAWRAAGWLLRGESPYAQMPLAPYAEGGLFLYPLTTAVVAAPFAPMPMAVAGTLFFALSTALMVYAVATRAPHLWPVFLSPAFLLAYYNIQWSPLAFAAALLPALGWLAVAKPNVGLEAFAYAPRWRNVWIGGAIAALTLALHPRWPLEWFDALRHQMAPHDPPVLWPLGCVGLIGLARWRTREGRMLAAATLAPAMTLPYDHLLLWLVARTWRDAMALTVTSWCAWLAVLATSPHDLTRTPEFTQLLLTLGLYIPATGIVLTRRYDANEGNNARPGSTVGRESVVNIPEYG